MPIPVNDKRAVPVSNKLLAGVALSLMATLAVAQKNLGELLDAGAQKVSGEQFKQDVVQRTLVGPTSSGVQLEVMYATSGVIAGRSDASAGGFAVQPGTNILAPIDGAWNIDDSGRICTSMILLRVVLPFRCQYWFKLKDDYFIADSDTDPKAKVLRRTVKQ